jgi:ribosome-binding protein aMBF1 (putative translation factor)
MMVYMKHECDLCGKSVKEVGRLTRLRIPSYGAHSGAVLLVCKSCRQNKGKIFKLMMVKNDGIHKIPRRIRGQ